MAKVSKKIVKSEKTAEIDKIIELSRSYKTRTQEESNYLYSYISFLVRDAKSTDDKLAKEALTELILLFKPKIYDTTRQYFKYVKDYMEIEDFMQESHAIFIALVIKYDPTIASFLYYVKEMYPRYVWSWVEKTFRDHRHLTELGDLDVPHPDYDTDDKVFSRLMANTYEQEFIDFIENIAKKETKTPTLRAVCTKYFLGTTTCRDLAAELGISYHAVYDYISKIKRELNYHLKHSANFDFFYSPDGFVVTKDK